MDHASLIFVAILYFGMLFWIAQYADNRRAKKRSLIASPSVYALSLAVYCTGWTFYGSVGFAAFQGLSFLTIYLGPTLMTLLSGALLRKLIRVSKTYSLTSLADCISFRYGQSQWLAGLVAVISAIGILPYISLQLKAISSSFAVMTSSQEQWSVAWRSSSIPSDAAFYITLVLILFALIFGVRRIDPLERHEGLVAVVAFESVVKLIAFLSLGLFVVYGLFDGFGNLFDRAEAVESLQSLWLLSSQEGAYSDWFTLLILSMLSFMLLPRQFQMAVIENVNESHVRRAIWVFPLYLLLINLFVLPIAFAGRLIFPEASAIEADTFVLRLPLDSGNMGLALLVFIGGLSAATGMIIVESVALSHMITNSLLMPLIIRMPFIRKGAEQSQTVLLVRRCSVAFVLLTSYLHFHYVAEAYPLVSTGLISFLAVAQLAPPLIGGLYWKYGNRWGAISGLIVGFSIWAYTSPFSQLINVGLFPSSLLESGPWGLEWLNPNQLLGVSLSPIAQATFWSLFLNTSFYIGVSLMTSQTLRERSQTSLVVDVYRYSIGKQYSQFWRGTATLQELQSLLQRFLGEAQTTRALKAYARSNNTDFSTLVPSAELVQYTEKLLSGAIGSVSARIMVDSVVKEEPLKLEEVMNILDETQQVISYSQQLEEKSRQLQETSEELKAANLRLRELDTLKDEFISTVTHELRTPLTSIRSFSEILYETPDISLERRKKFLSIIVKESERLTRLINQVLDFEKMESGKMEWQMDTCELQTVTENAINAVWQLADQKKVKIHTQMPETPLTLYADTDRLIQVLVNLLSNAIKYSPENDGVICVEGSLNGTHVLVRVKDNGVGIPKEEQNSVFEKFHQVLRPGRGNPSGSGLGLTICQQIIEHHQGKICVAPGSENGAVIEFTIPQSHELDL